MNVVLNLILVVQLLSALAMIGLILVQHGKGADMGTAFGSGASGSLFGATGSANFLSRFTAGLAALFFLSTLGLAMVSHQRPQAPTSIMDAAPATAPDAPKQPSDVPSAGSNAPAAPAAAASDVPPAGAATTGAAAAGAAAAGAAPAAGDAAVPKNEAADSNPK